MRSPSHLAFDARNKKNKKPSAKSLMIASGIRNSVRSKTFRIESINHR